MVEKKVVIEDRKENIHDVLNDLILKESKPRRSRKYVGKQ